MGYQFNPSFIPAVIFPLTSADLHRNLLPAFLIIVIGHFSNLVFTIPLSNQTWHHFLDFLLPQNILYPLLAYYPFVPYSLISTLHTKTRLEYSRFYINSWTVTVSWKKYFETLGKPAHHQVIYGAFSSWWFSNSQQLYYFLFKHSA